MPPDTERSRPRQEAAPTNPAPIVTQPADTERARRIRDWARRHLDAMEPMGSAVSTTVDYHAMGFDLGVPERRAAGIALLERERAE